MQVGGLSGERPGDGRVADHRRQAECRHAEHRVRVDRAHPERPQLHQRADERARDEPRKPRPAALHRRRDRRREPLHHRRHGHDQPAHGRLGQARAPRLRRRSAGQVERLQRRVPRDDRWRGQRRHQVGRQQPTVAAPASTIRTTTGAAACGPAIRLNPANQTLAEYITTPRDPAYNVDPVLDLGGPSCATRCGSTSAMVRSCTAFRAHGHVHAPNNQTQTFDNDSEEQRPQLHVTSQLNNAMRVKFAGSNQRSYGGSTLPAKEANGTSTANPTLFPNPLHTNGADRFVRRRTGLGGDAEVLRQHQRRLLRLRHVPGDRHAVLYRSAARVRRVEHVHRRGGFNGLPVPRHSRRRSSN